MTWKCKSSKPFLLKLRLIMAFITAIESKLRFIRQKAPMCPFPVPFIFINYLPHLISSSPHTVPAQIFLPSLYSVFIRVSTCMSSSVPQVWEQPWRSEGPSLLGASVKGSCEPPELGAGTEHRLCTRAASALTCRGIFTGPSCSNFTILFQEKVLALFKTQVIINFVFKNLSFFLNLKRNVLMIALYLEKLCQRTVLLCCCLDLLLYYVNLTPLGCLSIYVSARKTLRDPAPSWF